MIFEDPNDDANYLQMKKESESSFNEELSKELIKKVAKGELTEEQANEIWRESQ